MLLSTISLIAFLGLVAYDAWPRGSLVIGLLVIVVMSLQFLVYGMHQLAASVFRVGRAGTILIIQWFKDVGSGL